MQTTKKGQETLLETDNDLPQGAEWYAAWFINRGIDEADKKKAKNASEKEISNCYMTYAKLHKVLYLTFGMVLSKSECGFPIFGGTIRAHECGAVVHSIYKIAEKFDYGLIEEKLWTDALDVLEYAHPEIVEVMEQVYQKVWTKDRRETIRFCKNDSLWVTYAPKYDENNFKVIPADKIREHFKKYEFGVSGFNEITKSDLDEMRNFEVCGVAKIDYTNGGISSNLVDQVATLCGIRGYSNITSEGQTAYDNRLKEIGDNIKRLSKADDNDELKRAIRKHYTEAIKMRIDEYNGKSVDFPVAEFVLSRARNNIDAFLGLDD
ncbi:MAG: hypothetical protein FWC96_02760 [Oscillospiraceae bacterium]|nr:hypothetical protein [Oscillospiraceae bacterium]